jgi:XisI protein
MDTGLDAYRQIIERVLADHARYPYSYGEIDRQLVFDRQRDHYLLLSVGWHKHRVHGCVIHVDLIDGKCGRVLRLLKAVSLSLIRSSSS